MNATRWLRVWFKHNDKSPSYRDVCNAFSKEYATAAYHDIIKAEAKLRPWKLSNLSQIRKAYTEYI